jgi:hydroxymethylglutaryl-CoA lyase
LHNTRGTGLASAWEAVTAGVTRLDSSMGGFGGCPFAPGASGNIATEDLVYLLEESGIATGIDLDSCLAATHLIEGMVGHGGDSAVSRAGGRPSLRSGASADTPGVDSGLPPSIQPLSA